MIFYRHASRMLRDSYAPRFTFAAYAQEVAATYRYLLDRPVQVFPAPLAAGATPRDRSDVEVPTVAFLGEQRLEKGLARIPGIVQELLVRHKAIRIVVHNSWHEQRPENAALEALAAADSRVEVRLGTLTGTEWISLLQRVDVIALPYDQRVYSTATSGVALEAIPLVVPQGTPMARLLQGCGSPGIIAETSEVVDVVDAIGRLLDDFPAYARRATAASLDRIDRAGPEHVLRAILASCQGF